MTPKPADYIGVWEKPDPEFTAARKASKPGARWAVYQCHAFDSAFFGNRYWLATGADCTVAEPPAFCPGPGIQHAMSPFVGWLNLETGALEAE